MQQSSEHSINRIIVFSFVFLILVVQSLAITGNTTNHILWKAADGSFAVKGNTSSYQLSAGSYIQPVGNYTGSYNLCEGYYCIQRVIQGTAAIIGGGGGGGLCQEGYTLVYLNNKLSCIPNQQYALAKQGIPLKKDYFFYGIIFLFVFFFIRRRKKKKRQAQKESEEQQWTRK